LPTLNIKSSIKEFNDTEERDGYEGGEIILLGAYSGCGKTLWMLQECVNVVKQGFNAGCFILGKTYQHEVVEKLLSYLEDKPRREVKAHFKELYKKNESVFNKITFLNPIRI
jgi:K+-sensing histidine kinase KdpD